MYGLNYHAISLLSLREGTVLLATTPEGVVVLKLRHNLWRVLTKLAENKFPNNQD